MAGLFRFLSAFVVAIALLAGGSFFMVQYLIAQYSVSPPKPTFPNDRPMPSPKPVAAVKPAPAPKPSPKPPVTEGYRAKITQEIGLNIRELPQADGTRVGGVDYNEEVIVLEDSPDKNWQKIRLLDRSLEGWVKAGYTDRVN
jgi:hypothetical protein